MDSLALSQQLTESAKKLLRTSELQIYVNTEWGSQNPTHREMIREEIQKRLPANWHSSVSHTQGLGVIALAPIPIGIDVELTARVTPQVIARISAPEELTAAPNASALWCAKEACFKALRGYDQPSVVSRISIGAWENIDSQSETFKLLNFTEFNSPSENKGAVTIFSTWSLAFFIFPS